MGDYTHAEREREPRVIGGIVRKPRVECVYAERS